MPSLPEAGTVPSRQAFPSSAGHLLRTLITAQERLARRLVEDRHAITGPELNHVVLMTLLRILFLRTGQACSLSPPETLALLAGSDGIAKKMERACVEAGLSQGLFYDLGAGGPRGRPDPSDDSLREVIGILTQPDIPVPAAGLSPEELAMVLDELLATRLEVSDGYRVSRTNKSVILYTGTVDVPDPQVTGHIVRAALAALSETPSQSQANAVKVLDPACGAGIFLLAMFRALTGKYSIQPGQDGGMDSGLPGVLCSSIYGVDIDPESVKAARFVLLVGFIDACRAAGTGRALPDLVRRASDCLQRTVQCGNSLIGPEYFAGKPVPPFNAEERRRVNTFDWGAGFPEILAAGGFDIVIGAPPPYRPLAVSAREEYFQTHYETYAPNAGLYGYFTERSLTLLKPDGILAFLVPASFLRHEPARPLRRFLLTRRIQEIADTGRDRLLEDGPVRMLAIVIRNRVPGRGQIAVGTVPGEGHTARGFTLDQSLLGDGGWRLEDSRGDRMIQKIRAAGTPLERYALNGIEPGRHRARNNPFVVERKAMERLLKKAWWCRRFFLPLLSPADIRRYVPVQPERFVIAVKSRRDLRKCRALREYLKSAALDLGESVAGTTDDTPAPEIIGGGAAGATTERAKIVFAPFQHVPAFTYDPKGVYATTDSLLAINQDDPVLAAVLNSSLGRFVITHTCTLTDRGYYLSPERLGRFPVIVMDFDNPSEKHRHDKTVALIRRMLALHEYLRKAPTDQDRRLVQQELDATDVKIDELVYEMYGLSSEEIAFIDGEDL